MHRRPSSQSQSRCCCSFLCSLPEFPLGRWKPCRQPSWDHSAFPLSPSERSAEGRDKPGPVKLTEGHNPLLLGFADAVWCLWAWSPLRDPSAIRSRCCRAAGVNDGNKRAGSSLSLGFQALQGLFSAWPPGAAVGQCCWWQRAFDTAHLSAAKRRTAPCREALHSSAGPAGLQRLQVGSV